MDARVETTRYSGRAAVRVALENDAWPRIARVKVCFHYPSGFRDCVTHRVPLGPGDYRDVVEVIPEGVAEVVVTVWSRMTSPVPMKRVHLVVRRAGKG